MHAVRTHSLSHTHEHIVKDATQMEKEEEKKNCFLSVVLSQFTRRLIFTHWHQHINTFTNKESRKKKTNRFKCKRKLHLKLKLKCDVDAVWSSHNQLKQNREVKQTKEKTDVDRSIGEPMQNCFQIRQVTEGRKRQPNGRISNGISDWLSRKNVMRNKERKKWANMHMKNSKEIYLKAKEKCIEILYTDTRTLRSYFPWNVCNWIRIHSIDLRLLNPHIYV